MELELKWKNVTSAKKTNQAIEKKELHRKSQEQELF